MTRPVVQVRCAFANNPFVADSTLTWTDITSDVRIDPAQNGAPIQIRRGRQNELGRVEAGSMSLVLDNRARQYDSEYTSGPYYPNIIPMKRIQVRATWSSTIYYLFTGYVTAWTPNYPGPRDSVVRVTATDAFNAIARSTVSVTSFPPGEISGYAIRTALTQIGWPVTTDYLFPGGGIAGQTNIPAGTYANQNTLQYINNITEAENGLFYVQGNGKLAFQDRQWRIRNNGSSATFGDGAGELPYEDLNFTNDEQLIYNDIQVTPAGGSMQKATDSVTTTLNGALTSSATTITVVSAASFPASGSVLIDAEQINYTGATTTTLTGCTRGTNGTTAASHSSGAGVVLTSTSTARYGPRVLAKTGLLMGTDGIDALGMAQWLLLRYKDPALRIPQIVLNGDLDSSVWIQMLARDLSDKITVLRRPPGGGTITKSARIEAISHSIGLDAWRTTWDLSLAGEDQYWILQDSTYGVLNSTTKLAF